MVFKLFFMCYLDLWWILFKAAGMTIVLTELAIGKDG